MFSALNESSSSENEDESESEVFTREVQEEEAYSLYKLALSDMCLQQYEDARSKLKKVLDLPFLSRVRPASEETEEKGPVSPPLKLKYLVYKNLASIAVKQKDYRDAVDAYLEALEIDPTDVSVWYETGISSLRISNYPLSRLAFEEGFKRYPNHWPCLDNLITVTYVLNDYANCLYYISRGLEKEHGYVKALAFKDKIFEEDPFLKQFCEGYFSDCNPCIHTATYDEDDAKEYFQEALELREKNRQLIKPTVLPIINLKQPLKEYTWRALGESLMATYDYISSSDTFISVSCKIDLSECLTDLNALAVVGNEKNVSELSETCQTTMPFSSEQCSKDGLLQVSSTATVDQLNSQGISPDYSEKMDTEEMQNSDSHSMPNYSLPQIDCAVPVSDPLFLSDTSFGNKKVPKRKLSTDIIEKGGKRRSMRVRNPTIRRHQDNVNYQELLQQFLPVRFSEATDNAESDNEISCDVSSGDHTYGQSAGNIKTSDKSLVSPDVNNITSSEKDEVRLFLMEHQQNGGIVDLLYKYVIKLGSFSNQCWPKPLPSLFSFVFLRLRKHIVMPNLFCHEEDTDFIKDTGIAVLTFSELKVDQWYLSTGHSTSSSTSSFSPKLPYTVSSFQIGPDSIGKNFHADMEFLMQLTVRRDVLNEDWLDFVVRVLWLKAKFHSVEGEVDMAVSCLDRLVDVLQKENQTTLEVVVANSYFSNVITLSNAQQQLELLERCQSLEEVQRLYDRGAYQSVVDLLVVTFRPSHSKTKVVADGNIPERHAQLILLQDSLLKLKNYQECVHWTEVAFNEAIQQFFNVPTISARNDWSDTMAHLLSGFEKCIKINSNLLNEMSVSKLSRFSQNLILLICILMESYDVPSESPLTVLPWIVLYRLIANEEALCNVTEQSSNANSSKNTSKENLDKTGLQSRNDIVAANASFVTKMNASIPISIMLLLTAHECLGRRSYCCVSNGKFLLHCVDVMINQLQNITGVCREDLEHGLEQCFYCLYGHPSKRTKAKHLQEHSSQQISLTWECAMQIYEYFKPDILPEFDSYRTSTVSSELETLLRRIALLVPPKYDPSNHVDFYTAYIEGGVDTCPKFPPGTPPQNLIVKDLYYLLGDFYFKNKEFSKAVRYYLLDICINPDRQDSWAGMALSRSSQLEQKLNSYEVRNEGTIYRKSSAALRCFEHALQLNSYTTPLWIEYGSLAYVLHSHASRQLKQGSYLDSPRDLLKNKRDEMLLLAERCFLEANKSDDGSDPEEAWLHHYMLGKISQKLKRDPSIYLEHYQKSLMYLHEDEARYPTKIQYHNPPEFSIEVLEVYYRIHASCLKILTKFENVGMPQQQLQVIVDCIKAVSTGPFVNFQEKEKYVSSSASESELENIKMQPEIISQNKIPCDHNYSNKQADILESVVEKKPHLYEVKMQVDGVYEVKNEIALYEIKDSIPVSEVETINPVLEVKKEMPNVSEIENVNPEIVSERMPDPAIEDVVDYLLNTVRDLTPKKCAFSEKSDSLAAAMKDCQPTSPGKMFSSEVPVLFINEKSSEKPNSSLNASSSKKRHWQEDKIESDENSTAYVDSDVKLTVDSMLKKLEYLEVCKTETSCSPIVSPSSNKNKETNEFTAEDFESVLTVFDEMLYCIQQNKEYVYFDNINSQNDAKVNKHLQKDSSSSKVASVSCEDSQKLVKSFENVPEHDKINNSTSNVNLPMIKVEEKLVKNSSLPNEEACTKTVIQSPPKPSRYDAKILAEKSSANNTLLPSKNPQVDQVTTSSKKTANEPEKSFISIFSCFLQKESANRENIKDDVEESKIIISESIQACLDALRECLKRFIQHYKSLYRIAFYYCYSNRSKNLQWAREILLAATPGVKNYPPMPGLFAERKNTNLFNGIWRAPSNEIDRPGSFGAHMFRSVRLLIDVLYQQMDYNMLLYLTQQLHRIPDFGKKYMRDTERSLLAKECYGYCVTILQDQMNGLLQEEPPPEESRLTCCLLEIFRTYQALTKANIYPDDTNELLEEAYKMYKLGEVDPTPSILHQAVTFCQRQLGKSYQLAMKPADVVLYRNNQC